MSSRISLAQRFIDENTPFVSRLKRMCEESTQVTFHHGLLVQPKGDDVSTPPRIKTFIERYFDLDHDPCPLYGIEDPPGWGVRNFVNPPYSDIQGWIKKAEAQFHAEISVFFIPWLIHVPWFYKMTKKYPAIPLPPVTFVGYSQPSHFSMCLMIIGE